MDIFLFLFFKIFNSSSQVKLNPVTDNITPGGASSFGKSGGASGGGFGGASGGASGGGFGSSSSGPQGPGSVS